MVSSQNWNVHTVTVASTDKCDKCDYKFKNFEIKKVRANVTG